MKTTEVQAQVLAVRAIEDYVSNCQCDSEEDIVQVMMKLVGTAERALQGLIGTPNTIKLLKIVLADMSKNPEVQLNPIFEQRKHTIKH